MVGCPSLSDRTKDQVARRQVIRMFYTFETDEIDKKTPDLKTQRDRDCGYGRVRLPFRVFPQPTLKCAREREGRNCWLFASSDRRNRFQRQIYFEK